MEMTETESTWVMTFSMKISLQKHLVLLTFTMVSVVCLVIWALYLLVVSPQHLRPLRMLLSSSMRMTQLLIQQLSSGSSICLSRTSMSIQTKDGYLIRSWVLSQVPLNPWALPLLLLVPALPLVLHLVDLLPLSLPLSVAL